MNSVPLGLAVRSELPGLLFPALAGTAGLQLHSMFLQLERSQWLPPERLEQQQFRQLDALLAHVWATVPWYHPRLHAAGIVPDRPVERGAWQSLQLLTRRDLQESGALLHSSRVPPGHGAIHCNRTSGSTG